MVMATGVEPVVPMIAESALAGELPTIDAIRAIGTTKSINFFLTCSANTRDFFMSEP